MLLGPAFLLYAESALQRRPCLARHAVGAAAALGLLAAIAFKVEVRATGGALAIDDPPLWVRAAPLVLLLIAGVYPILVLRLVARRSAELRDRLSSLTAADPGWLRLWALSSLAVLGGLLSLSLAQRLAGWPIDLHLTLTLLVLVGHLAFVGHRGLTRSGAFFATTDAQAPNAGTAARFDLETARLDYQQVKSLLAEQRPHLNPELTAADLADRLGWGAERLTVALRHGGRTSFFDAVNSARVRALQAMAADPANAQVSLLSLAHDAGFGSKSAFYEAFVRHTGFTPAAWRRRKVDHPSH